MAMVQTSFRRIVTHPFFERCIIAVIVLNALTLGLETSPAIMARAGQLLILLDHIFLSVFVGELVLKLYVYRGSFFRNRWNVFDFLIIGIALVPGSGPFTVLRALRVLRVLRLVSVVPALRRVVDAFMHALSGLAAVGGLLLVVFYVGAVMSTKIFGSAFPDFFGSLWRSLYSLFQIMTLESWSMGIVRPVMEVYPYAWLFFVPFILITTFSVLNLLIGIVVNSMQEIHMREQQQLDAKLVAQHENDAILQGKLAVLESLVREVKESIASRRADKQ